MRHTFVSRLPNSGAIIRGWKVAAIRRKEFALRLADKKNNSFPGKQDDSSLTHPTKVFQE